MRFVQVMLIAYLVGREKDKGFNGGSGYQDFTNARYQLNNRHSKMTRYKTKICRCSTSVIDIGSYIAGLTLPDISELKSMKQRNTWQHRGYLYPLWFRHALLQEPFCLSSY